MGNSDIGKRIKVKRNDLGLTLEDVAKVSGVSRQTIQRYESGVIKNIPSDRIENIAKALRTTPEYLMGWKDTWEDIIEKDCNIYNSYIDASNAGMEIVLAHPELARLFEEIKKLDDNQIDLINGIVMNMKKKED